MATANQQIGWVLGVLGFSFDLLDPMATETHVLSWSNSELYSSELITLAAACCPIRNKENPQKANHQARDKEPSTFLRSYLCSTNSHFSPAKAREMFQNSAPQNCGCPNLEGSKTIDSKSLWRNMDSSIWSLEDPVFLSLRLQENLQPDLSGTLHQHQTRSSPPPIFRV